MRHPTFDAGGYPTDETLQAIREWPGSLLPSLFAFVREAWRYPDYWKQDGGTHNVSTGGWSGNEDLLVALGDNHIAWLMCWQSSARGGHYVFRVAEPHPATKEGADLGDDGKDGT